MLGKILSANGKANSINGMIRNMEKGTSRKRSETVRSNCLRSRRVKVEPRSVLPTRLRAVWTSPMRSCMAKRVETKEVRTHYIVNFDQTIPNIPYLRPHSVMIKFLLGMLLDFGNLFLAILRMRR